MRRRISPQGKPDENRPPEESTRDPRRDADAWSDPRRDARVCVAAFLAFCGFEFSSSAFSGAVAVMSALPLATAATAAFSAFSFSASSGYAENLAARIWRER